MLANTSTGVPADFDTADALLASLGMNLPGAGILSGDVAEIAPGSVGLGAWSSYTAGDSVSDEWLWTNDFGGDLMTAYVQVISTSDGQGGGVTTRFDGSTGGVGGPFGGIAANPPLLEIPGSQPAVSNAIHFTLALSSALTEEELESVANTSIVEFGSSARYLGVPEPATLTLLAAAFVCARRIGP